MDRFLASKCKKVRVFVCNQNDIKNIVTAESPNESFAVKKTISDLSTGMCSEYGVYPIYFGKWFCLMDFKSILWSRLSEPDSIISSFQYRTNNEV